MAKIEHIAFSYLETKEYVREDFERFFQMGFTKDQILPAVLNEYEHAEDYSKAEEIFIHVALYHLFKENGLDESVVSEKAILLILSEERIRTYDESAEFISDCSNLMSEENLIRYISSYNWDEGFDIPRKILEEKECSLQVALLVFELADGFSYLETKGEGNNLPEWKEFTGSLYRRILGAEFKKGKCAYLPELTKVQKYKMEKLLREEEIVFVTPISNE